MMHVGWIVAGAIAMSGTVLADDVVREGSGDRRAALDRMELEPMPASWDDLSSWSGGEVTRSSTAGKPVLIVSWASWYPKSVRALSTAQRLADEYGDRGLVVVGVHHKDGFEGADAAIEARSISFPTAHDADGSFREALMIDNDPDYYLIDRAGQLRFADVAPSSVEQAVKMLVGESENTAGNIEAIRAREAAAEAARLDRLQSINADLDDLAALPDVPFAEPPASAYEDLNWPELSEEYLEDVGVRRTRSRRGSDEERPDIKVEVPQGLFHPAPPSTNGRIVAMYMWHPEVRDSYWPEMNDMDILQRKHLRDVRVVGVMVPRDQLINDRNRRDEETPEELHNAFRYFTDAREYDHTLVLDAGGELRSSLGGSARGSRNSTAGTSRLILVSTDGVVRWVGPITMYNGALDRMLKIDPGVAARREAERRYIESHR